jgi:hypothetical protein
MDAPLSRSSLTKDDKQRIRERRMEQVMMGNTISPKKPARLTSSFVVEPPMEPPMDPRSSYMEMLQALRVQEEHILAKRKMKDQEEHRGPVEYVPCEQLHHFPSNNHINQSSDLFVCLFSAGGGSLRAQISDMNCISHGKRMIHDEHEEPLSSPVVSIHQYTCAPPPIYTNLHQSTHILH